MIDLYSHFGTRYSYATIASVLGRALRRAGLLAGVYNLDSEWHPDYEDLQAGGTQPRGSHIFVVAAPNHYVADLTSHYSRERAALFVSPNTDTMAQEHIDTVGAFGRALVTSGWCLRTLRRGLMDQDIVYDVQCKILPLGVDESFVGVGERLRTPKRGETLRALHLTTDQCWPGRKGTEELLAAWETLMTQREPALRRGGWRVTAVPLLTIHAPQSLERDILYRIADHGLQEYVSLAVEERGAVAGRLADLYAAHDVVVLPSRCEGFGMMILAALVARVPLITTYVTGQTDFLAERGGWIGVPTCATGNMAYETGSAPLVEVPVLTNTLEFALHDTVLARLRENVEDSPPSAGWGTWSAAAQLWVEYMREWTQETA